MLVVKICGITNIEDAVSAYEAGADLLGFVFTEKSPRYLTGEKARALISEFRGRAPGFKGITGLFLNQKLDAVIEKIILCGLDAVQLHGDEKPGFCTLLKTKLLEKYDRGVKIIKTFKVDDDILPVGDYIADDFIDADYFLFDTYTDKAPGGTGQKFNWKVLVKNKNKLRKPFLLAGGLTPSNVKEAVRKVDPFGVDISSGVERSPGKKDPESVKEFIANAKDK